MNIFHPEPLEAINYREKKKYGQISDLKFHKTCMPNSSKALDISSATTRLAPDLLKALAILSDTTVRRCEVDQKELKPYWKSGKRSHFSS